MKRFYCTVVMLLLIFFIGLWITGCYKVLAALVTFVLLVAVLKKVVTTL